jgi:hypothetical protein
MAVNLAKDWGRVCTQILRIFLLDFLFFGIPHTPAVCQWWTPISQDNRLLCELLLYRLGNAPQGITQSPLASSVLPGYKGWSPCTALLPAALHSSVLWGHCWPWLHLLPVTCLVSYELLLISKSKTLQILIIPTFDYCSKLTPSSYIWISHLVLCIIIQLELSPQKLQQLI